MINGIICFIRQSAACNCIIHYLDPKDDPFITTPNVDPNMTQILFENNQNVSFYIFTYVRKTLIRSFHSQSLINETFWSDFQTTAKWTLIE